jgi:hypothetical protein
LDTTTAKPENICTNYDPIPVEEGIPTQVAFIGFPYEYTFPKFCDSIGDTLTYSLTMEDGSTTASWLTFTAVDKRLSGFTNNNSLLGSSKMKIVATDQDGKTGQFVFPLIVNRKPIVANPITPDP